MTLQEYFQDKPRGAKIAMARKHAGEPQQFLFENRGLIAGDDQRGGFANLLDRACMMSKPLQFRQKHAQNSRPGRS